MPHLYLIQRQQIAFGIRSGKSNGQIARELGVHVSTVGREIRRNSPGREAYAAEHAQLIAASTQVVAARERFAHRKEETISNRPPAGTRELDRFRLFLPPSPYAPHRIPVLPYHRPAPLQGMAFHISPRYYVYDMRQYIAFMRPFKPSGQFRLSGKALFPAFSSWDIRERSGESFPALPLLLVKPCSDSKPAKKTNTTTLSRIRHRVSSYSKEKQRNAQGFIIVDELIGKENIRLEAYKGQIASVSKGNPVHPDEIRPQNALAVFAQSVYPWKSLPKGPYSF